jgi:hypothetical protein
MVKKHHQELGIAETEEPAVDHESPPTDDDSDLASLARELARENEDDGFCPLDSPFIKKVPTHPTIMITASFPKTAKKTSTTPSKHLVLKLSKQ